ncbi:MAG: plasmid partitioning protein RepB C-terminal domain-containing protein, partial [Planctomycetota bacterium]
MKSVITLACEPKIRTLPINKLLPVRKFAQAVRKTTKYKRIACALREVGVIEPLVVFECDDDSGQFLLLDGHIRLDVLKEAGESEVECLVAQDDEGFTYNHKVNRLSAIQEHFMIIKALDNGVSEEDIARTLNVDTHKIRSKRDLLEGVCPEAVKLLRDRKATSEALGQIRKAKPMRQIEMAELMCASHNFSGAYAKCLLAATPADQLVAPDGGKKVDELTPEEMARMEREMKSLSKDFRDIEETHGKNVLNLV